MKSKGEIAERRKAYYQANKARIAAYYQENKARILAAHRAWDERNAETQNAKRRELYAQNPEYYKTRIRDYYASHPEKLLEKGRARRAKNPGEGAIHSEQRRARKLGNGGVFTRSEWEAVKHHYGYRCYYCSKKGKQLTMDHITPLSRGGKHDISNIVPACRSCNSHKGTRAATNVQPVLLLPFEKKTRGRKPGTFKKPFVKTPVENPVENLE